MGKGGGGTQVVKNEIPEWLEAPVQGNIDRAQDISNIGYVPYAGPDVAAFTPMQTNAMRNNNQMARAFGMSTQPVSAGMPKPQRFAGGVQGYSSLPLFNQSVDHVKQNRRGQFDAIAGQFIDPRTGAAPAAGPWGPQPAALTNAAPSFRSLLADGAKAGHDGVWRNGRIAYPGGAVMYGKSGNFNAARGAAQGLQNAMTQTTRTMNRGPATANFAASNLRPFQQQLRANAGYDPRNLQAANAGVRGARDTLAGGQNFQAGQIAQTNLSPYMNQYQGQVIDNALSDMDRARKMAQNDTGAQATAAGAFGGSRHALVEAENNRNFAEQAARMAAEQRAAGFDRAQSAAQSDISARTQNRQFNAGQRMADRGMDLQAAGQLAGMAGQAFNQSNQINNQMMQQGSMQQALQQQLINAGKGQFGGWTGAPQNALNLPLMAVGAAPNVGTQTTTQSGGGSGLMDALGFGAAILPYLSDRRAKEDIRRVGQTDGGLPVYVYRYKGGDTFHMGVMAQEVEAVQPEAVVERQDGLKAVRYDLLEA